MFTHLHVHSNYSDGLAHPIDLIERAKQLGYVSIALTDHNTLDGHAALLTAAHFYGIRPILGAEIRIHTRLGHGHAVVLPRSEEEYLHLHWLIRRKKKILLGDLKRAGLVTTGCLGGVIPGFLRRHDYWSARDTIQEYRDELGAGFVLEVQPNFGSLLAWMLSLGRQAEIPVVATNDVHYLDPEDAQRHINHGLYLASEEQMRAFSPLAGYSDAIEATAYLATNCWPHSEGGADANGLATMGRREWSDFIRW